MKWSILTFFLVVFRMIHPISSYYYKTVSWGMLVGYGGIIRVTERHGFLKSYQMILLFVTRSLVSKHILFTYLQTFNLNGASATRRSLCAARSASWDRPSSTWRASLAAGTASTVRSMRYCCIITIFRAYVQHRKDIAIGDCTMSIWFLVISFSTPTPVH